MPLLPYKVIILDFDGVLVESNAIKTQAFEVLFARYPQHLPAILEYHHSNTLIRFKKFQYIYEHILKRPYTSHDEAVLAKSFSDFCIEAVIRCPEVNGAQVFLEHFHGRVPLYLVSINPLDDLNQILKARSLSRFFKRIYAVEGSKAAAIQDILQQENLKANQAVFIGDSAGDYQSAQKVGINFIGRSSAESLDFSDIKVFVDMVQILAYLTTNVCKTKK